MTIDALRRRSRLLRDLVTFAFAVVALALLTILAAVIANGAPAVLWVRQLPLVFYLAAIWMVRQALAAIARGGSFERTVARMIGRVGVVLALGALTNVFFGPWLGRVLFGRGPIAAFDPAAITLGVIGFALVLLASILGSAADMRAELDEIV